MGSEREKKDENKKNRIARIASTTHTHTRRRRQRRLFFGIFYIIAVYNPLFSTKLRHR